MYILECSNGMYYTGSTNNLELRLQQHQNGEGANFTKKHLPVKLVYFEEFARVDEAFYREKQIQGWSRKKKEALINNQFEKLHDFAECKNETHFLNVPFDSAQGTGNDSAQGTGNDSAQGTENNSAQGTENNSAQGTAPTRLLSGAETTDSLTLLKSNGNEE